MQSGQKIEQRLSGKVALVTGASRGIGAAIALRLAAEGASVLVNYSRSADAAKAVVDEITSAGGTATLLGGDVGDPKQIEAMLKKVDESAGRIDILVNNAGVYETGPIDQFSDEKYQKTVAVNMNALFYLTKAAVGRMNDGGRVINIGSGLGERVPVPGHAVYAASKFFVVGFTRGVAQDLAGRKITANVVQPGPIDTDMNPADAEKNPGADFMRSMIPLKRYGRVEEIASAVAFLASDEASFITGQELTVDGGMMG